MNYARPLGIDLPAVVLTTGIVITPRVGDPAAKGVTLASGTTYVFALGGESAPLESIHIVWDAAIIVTFTIEDSNMPSGLGGPGGPADVSNWDGVLGNWVQENPTTAYVAVANPGSGVTVTNLTIVTAGTAANAAMIHMGNFGSRRSRLKAVVAGTGGSVRVIPHGKA